MSYILEALKKVEQRREQEDASKPPTFSAERAEERKKIAVWPYVVAAALLLNAGLALWLFGPWKPHGGEPSLSALPVEPPSAPSARSEEGIAKPPAVAAEIVKNEGTPSRDAERKATPRAGRKEAAEAVPPKVRDKGEEERASLVPIPKEPASPAQVPEEVQVLVEKSPVPAAPAGKVVALSDLPPSVRSSLPEFKVSGHAYGPDAQTRVVRINEKILQEGQELSPGLKVEEIVPDGIILSYGGYRFRIPAKVN